MKFHKFLFFLLLTVKSFANDTTDALNVTKYSKKGNDVNCVIVDSDLTGWERLKNSYNVNIVEAVNYNVGSQRITQLEDSLYGWGHGTEMARIFSEIAPDARVYLVLLTNLMYPGINNTLLDWLVARNIKIVSISLDFRMDLPFSGIPAAYSGFNSFSDYINHGILVFSIMGNHQKGSHYARLQKNSSNQMIFPDGNSYIDVVADASDANLYIYKQENMGNSYTFTAENISRSITSQKNFSDIDGSAWFSSADLGVCQNDIIRLSIVQTSGISQTLNIRIDLENHVHLKDTIPDPTASISVPGCVDNIITCGAINRDLDQFGPGKENQISSLSCWGPVMGDTLANGTLIHEYMKPDFAVGVHGNETSPTAPTAAACCAVFGSQDLTRFNNIRALKQEFFDKNVCPANIAVFGYKQGDTEKTHGRGVLCMDYREKKWSHLPPTPTGPTIPFLNVEYSNPTSLSRQEILKFSISSPDTSAVTAYIFTVPGELVKYFSTQNLNFADEKVTIEWDFKNQDGRKVAPGVYFFVVQTNLGKRIQKLALTK
jgi:hypothetical protein